jgi:O-antigen/teichoic acid export membrane protein
MVRPFDKSGSFLQAAEEVELHQLAARGAGVTVLSGGLTLGVQVIATLVLARLLAPSDFGLMAMVTTFSLLFVNFGWNGFTEAILQRKVIDDSLISNLFWINVGAGVLLTIAFAAAGSLLVRFYGDPRVGRVAIGVSTTIFFTSLSVQHLALLKRAMRFSAVSANDIVARAVSVIVSILLAWAGWGYWALVAGAVGQASSMCIGAWILCRWIPSVPKRAPGTAEMVRFAMSTYGRFIANYSTWNLDNLLVGWRFGAISLGFYKKAYDLFAMSASQLVAPLTAVAVSALSRLDRESTQYRHYLLGALGVTAFLGMGVGADLTLVGQDLIRLLLGPRWGESGRIFVFFGPGIGVMLLYYTHGWIHLAIGRADRWLRWGLVEFTVTALLLVLGLHWGPVGIAALWYAGRPIRFGIAPVIAAVWKYVLASLLAGVASAAIIRTVPILTAASGWVLIATRIVLVTVLFGILYLGAVIVLHRGCAPLHQVAGLLRDMVQRKLSAPSQVGSLAGSAIDATETLVSKA